MSGGVLEGYPPLVKSKLRKFKSSINFFWRLLLKSECSRKVLGADHLSGRPFGRPIGGPIGRPNGRPNGPPIGVDRSMDRSVNRSVDRSVDRSVNRSLDRSVDRTDRSTDRSTGSVDKTVIRSVPSGRKYNLLKKIYFAYQCFFPHNFLLILRCAH